MQRIAIGIAIGLSVSQSGCPWCSLDTDLDIIEGSTTVVVGGRVTFALDSEGFEAGPGRCGGHWYVDGIEGGDATVGTITSCGEYTAPVAPLANAVEVEASQYAAGTCADCCPYGWSEVRVVAP